MLAATSSKRHLSALAHVCIPSWAMLELIRSDHDSIHDRRAEAESRVIHDHHDETCRWPLTYVIFITWKTYITLELYRISQRVSSQLSKIIMLRRLYMARRYIPIFRLSHPLPMSWTIRIKSSADSEYIYIIRQKSGLQTNFAWEGGQGSSFLKSHLWRTWVQKSCELLLDYSDYCHCEKLVKLLSKDECRTTTVAMASSMRVQCSGWVHRNASWF